MSDSINENVNNGDNVNEDIDFSVIEEAFYLNLIIINKGYYHDNEEISGPTIAACLKLGSIDNAASKTSRNWELRCEEHKKKYGALESIPMLAYSSEHPKALETCIKVLLEGKNVKIGCISGADIKFPDEFYPIQWEIIETIETYMEENGIPLLYRNDDIMETIECDDQEDSDALFDLIDEYIGYHEELVIIDSQGDSLSNEQIQQLKQNSILNTY